MTWVIIGLGLIYGLVRWYDRRKHRHRTNVQSKKAIGLTSQTSQGKVMREILYDLRRRYPGHSEAWYWQKAKSKVQKWGGRL